MKKHRLVLLLSVLALGTFAVVSRSTLFRHERSYQGKPTSYWVQRACKGDQSQATLTALETIGPEAKTAIPALIEALEDKQEPFREGTIRALKTIDAETAARILGAENAK